MTDSKILTGMRQAVAHAKGEKVDVRETVVKTPAHVNVREVRERLGQTQEEFARSFGFSVGSVRNWEQEHRQPEGPARVLLTVIAREPDAVIRALA
jgi:putative transcriptional regulator